MPEVGEGVFYNDIAYYRKFGFSTPHRSFRGFCYNFLLLMVGGLKTIGREISNVLKSFSRLKTADLQCLSPSLGKSGKKRAADPSIKLGASSSTQNL